VSETLRLTRSLSEVEVQGPPNTSFWLFGEVVLENGKFISGARDRALYKGDTVDSVISNCRLS